VSRLTGLMWWIDRWRTSAAYSDMTLEEQGAYRNLLDEAALRGGALPDDPRVLAKACGDAERWPAVRTAVLRRFCLFEDGWHSATLDAVLDETARRIAERATWREQKAGQRGGQGGGQRGGQQGGQVGGKRPLSGSVSGSESGAGNKTPLPPFAKGGRLTKRDLKQAEERRTRVYGGCPHTPRCPAVANCIRQLAQDAKALL